IAMRTPWWTAVLLLALIVSTYTQDNRYAKFLWIHMDFPMTPARTNYCQNMIARRCVNAPGTCKDINTFVHAPAPNLTTICANQPNGSLQNTQQRELVTVCRLIGGPPNCRYAGTQYNRFVRVRCEDGFPMHLNTT
ncbi:RSFR Ribonuclease, partial [Alectura lathami]|nr:RSFR Ribonuclease [Alectura lathami]